MVCMISLDVEEESERKIRRLKTRLMPGGFVI